MLGEWVRDGWAWATRLRDFAIIWECRKRFARGRCGSCAWALVLGFALATTPVFAEEASGTAAASAAAAGPSVVTDPPPVGAAPAPAGAAAELLRRAQGYEQRGKKATAWTFYVRAAEQALLTEQTELHSQAIQRAEALLGELSRLTVVVSPLNAAAVRLDNKRLPRNRYALPVPLDPGAHVLTAKRRGYFPWKMEFQTRAGEVYSVTVPTLALATPAPAPPRVLAPVAPPLAAAPSAPPSGVAVGAKLQAELDRLREAREDVTLAAPIIMLAAGAGLTVVGGIDLLTRAAGTSGVLVSGSGTAFVGAGAVIGGVTLGIIGGFLFNSRLEKRRILDSLIERRVERLHEFGVVAVGVDPFSRSFTVHGTF